MSTATAAPSSPASKDAPRLFDRNKHFHIKTPHSDFPNGKWCTVRFPTDAEWCQQAKQQVTVSKSVGRDSTRAEVPKLVEAAAALFDKIDQKSDDDTPLDDVEKFRVIERLERCEVVNVEKVAGKYQIKMLVFGKIEVMHELKIPSQKDVMDFGKAAVKIESKRLVRETQIALEPSATLWLRLCSTTEGYEHSSESTDGFVPIIHMNAALGELLLQVHAEIEAEDDSPED